MGITLLDTQSFCRNAFGTVFPQLHIMQSQARRVSIRNTETHGSIISGTQDVTNGGEPMSFADSLVEPLRQAPVLGKDGGGKGLSHVNGTSPETNVMGWKSENTLSFHLGG